ncbi:MAG: TIGR00282 family metallophosphoesterase [bacterium]
MKLLILGDIVGEEGLKFLESKIQTIRKDYKFNLLVVNGENVTNGKGLSEAHYKRLMKMNVSAITMGNHTFRNKEIEKYIDNSNVVRPLNINVKHGYGFLTINYNNKLINIINLLGTFAMDVKFQVANPFVVLNDFLDKMPSTDYTIVDFHAESTGEKYALAHAFDGKVDLVYGTHTHVQTADEQVLPGKTMFISDVGMTGPSGGVLGVKKEIIVNRMWHGHLDTFQVSKTPCMINGILVDLETKKIKRINIK